MKKEYFKYVDKPTWCSSKTAWDKNSDVYEELKIKDMNEKEELYSDCNTKAFINTKEIDEHFSQMLKKKFDTKYIATYSINNSNGKYIMLRGISLKLENRIKGDYKVYDEAVLNGSRFGIGICKVKMCENEDEVIQKLQIGNFEKLGNYENLEFHNIEDIEGIKKSIIFNIITTSNENNILKNYITMELSKEEKEFLTNLVYFKNEIINTHNYIKEFNEVNSISLKEVGEKHSIELANIMIELGYAGWHFEDLDNLEKMKEQMIDTINCDYYSEENAVNHGSTKEKIIEDIRKCSNKVLSEEGKDILIKLDISFLEKDIEEEDEEGNEI